MINIEDEFEDSVEIGEEEKSKGKPKTFWEEDGEVISSLVFIVILAIGSLFMCSWFNSLDDEYQSQVSDVQKGFADGSLKYPEASLIRLGTIQNASAGVISDRFPKKYGSEPSKIPTRWSINRCNSFSLPEAAQGIYVVAPPNVALTIQIVLPFDTSGTANICQTGGYLVEVLVWLP